MAISKTPVTVVASASNAAGATVRGVVDLPAPIRGGFLTLKITNGAIAPTVEAVGNILVAHAGKAPAAASAGADWKTIQTLNGGVVVNAVTELGLSIDEAVSAVEVEFTGNTVQAVTVEAFMTKLV